MPLPKFTLPLKPGHTTTEFWLIGAVGLISTALSMMQLLDAAWVVAGMALLTLGYNATRGKLKAIQAETESHLLKQNDAAAAKSTTAAE